MQQRVNFESYLAKAVLKLADLRDESYEAIVLPAGAEVLSVNVEVLEAATANTTLNVGLDADERFFASDLDLGTRSVNHNSTKQTRIHLVSKVSVKASKVSTKGEIALRVFYFCPSQIMTEF